MPGIYESLTMDKQKALDTIDHALEALKRPGKGAGT
jgi:hypothetical protein